MSETQWKRDAMSETIDYQTVHTVRFEPVGVEMEVAEGEMKFYCLLEKETISAKPVLQPVGPRVESYHPQTS